MTDGVPCDYDISKPKDRCHTDGTIKYFPFLISLTPRNTLTQGVCAQWNLPSFLNSESYPYPLYLFLASVYLSMPEIRL